MDWSPRLSSRCRYTFIIWLSVASFLVISQTNAATTANIFSSTSTTSTPATPLAPSHSSSSTWSPITTDTPNACHSIPGCLPIRNYSSCITITQNVGNANWFTSASSCEASGGRLVWLYDTNITEFANNELGAIKNVSCPPCMFFWVGLLQQSIGNDDVYFWKRSHNENIDQCDNVASACANCSDTANETECELLGCCFNQGSCKYPENIDQCDNVASACANCSDTANETECELLGCCFNQGSCKYPGNLTNDLQYKYKFGGQKLSYSDKYRHCVGLQAGLNNTWKLRTVKCSGGNLPQNGYICEYNCNETASPPGPSTRSAGPVTHSPLFYQSASSNYITTLRPPPSQSPSTDNLATTTRRYLGSSTDTSEKKSILWTIPFISLLSICAALLLICLICIIVICRLKKSLGRRSKLYPGAIPEDDEHTYMDLGDQPIRPPPPVELKSIVGSSDSETKLTEANETLKGIKSFKDRKRKPAPPLPQSTAPSKPPRIKEGIDQQVAKEVTSKTKEVKRQSSSLKKKPPSYNNSVPLDLSDDDEIGLYESYDHNDAPDSSYTNSMIEEVLTDTRNKNNTVKEDDLKNETQTQAVFGRENSNRLRNAQGSFIVSDDAHHEGLAFTERQISNSGLPEIVVQYNATKEAESPLDLQELQAYENQAFETIEEDSIHTEDEKIAQLPGNNDNASEIRNNDEESNIGHDRKIEIAEPEIPLYEDEDIPITVSEIKDEDALPLYEDADENPAPDPPFYDDNFVPDSTTAVKVTIDSLPIYDCADEVPETEEIKGNTIDLPVYELAVETNKNQPTYPNRASNSMPSSTVEHNGNNKKEEQPDPTNLDDLGLYEDYEISKLPLAPPPPIQQGLNDTFHAMDSTQVSILALNTDNGILDRGHNKMPKGEPGNMLPPEPPKRTDLNPQQRDSYDKILLEPSDTNDKNDVLDNSPSFDFNGSAISKEPANIDSVLLNSCTNKAYQDSQTKTPMLLDLSDEQERKFRSGSKIDVFDEPVISQSDAYFLDMNEAPSEIIDTSPVIGDEKLVNINTDSKVAAKANNLSAPSVFDSGSFGNTADASYGNILPHANLRNEKDKHIPNVTTDPAVNEDSVAIGALLDFGTEHTAPNPRQAGASVQPTKQNGDIQQLSDIVQINRIEDDSDIYDIPPPNFPPPELKLN